MNIFDIARNCFEPLEGDVYGRSRFQAASDNLFGVEEYQLRQRYGLNEIKVVEPEPYVRGWNDSVDDFCDMLLDRWGFCK